MTPSQRETVEAHLTDAQREVLEEALGAVGLPFRAWPHAGALASAVRYLAAATLARELQAEGESLTAALQAAGRRLGLAGSTVPKWKDGTLDRLRRSGVCVGAASDYSGSASETADPGRGGTGD